MSGIVGVLRRRPEDRLASVVGRRPVRRRLDGAALRAAVERHVLLRPRSAVTLASLLAAGAGWFVGGPVLSGIAALYAGAAATLVLRHRRSVGQRRAETSAIDAVAEVVGDLRAGARPSTLGLDVPGADAAVRAAVAVSEATGAPLADVLDRVHVQLRQAQRVREAATAHAAGTRATAFLLAVLPVGGVGLGYTMDADPLEVLLRTRLGAGCAVVAALLQLIGLVWTDRLSRVDGA